VSATSSGDAGWTAGVLLYSGRPDPSWTLDDETVRRLLTLWDCLPALDGPPLALRTALGYRGCFVHERAGGRWTAYDGVVQRQACSGGPLVARRDPSREVERRVIASAPPGVLPAGSIPEDLRPRA